MYCFASSWCRFIRQALVPTPDSAHERNVKGSCRIMCMNAVCLERSYADVFFLLRAGKGRGKDR